MTMTAQERERSSPSTRRVRERIQEAFARVPKEALQWRPEPGKWSVHEVIVHCADSETNAALRIRYLLAEKDPLIVGYDQDAWARVFDYHSEPSRNRSRRRRPRARGRCRSCGDEGAPLGEGGPPHESGLYTAEDWLRVYAAHLEGHARQIERNLEAWKARASSR